MSGRRTITVVGGGIAGLSAAWTLEQKRRAGADLDWHLIEAETRLGGKIWTETCDGFLIEHGADSFVYDKPGLRELIAQFDLEGDLLPIRPQARTVFIARGTRLIPLPRGMYLVVPTRLMPFLRSPLLTLRGRLRALLEPMTRVSKDIDDESLAAFVTRHFGKEALVRVAEPLMAGIHLADPERLSMQAAFPAMMEMERRFGSLLWAARASGRKSGPLPIARRVTLKQGMSQIIERLATELPESRVTQGSTVRRIERTGNGWRIDAGGESSMESDALILALPAPIAAELLADVEPETAQRLSRIEYAASANLTLAYASTDLPYALEGSGFLVPRTENRSITACSFVSSKFPNRAPENSLLLRVFFGGARDPEAAHRSDEELLSAAKRDLEDILGLTADPELVRVARFPLGTPQYVVGHLERVHQLTAGCPSNLAVAGSALYGVGLPECVLSGRDAAKKVLGV